VDITLRKLLGVDQSDSAAAEKAVDVKKVVATLRKQRYGMVQNPSQYLFCHQVCHCCVFNTMFMATQTQCLDCPAGLRRELKGKRLSDFSQGAEVSLGGYRASSYRSWFFCLEERTLEYHKSYS
jgi:hypothetical protein